MSPASTCHPVDEYRPVRKLVPFGVQHVLVMAATPISSVFLVSKTLGLSGPLTEELLAVAFVLSGIGTVIQSLGPWKVGVRLPFVMLPGGAPLVLFIAIAKQYDLRTAAGAVIITGAFYLVAVPVIARFLMRFFPTIVIGTLIVIIGVNLLYFGGVLITGKPGSQGFGNPRDLALGLATIGLTVLCFRILPGVLRQLSVMVGLIAGTVLAAVLGDFHLGPPTSALVHAPTPFPFGLPHFDVLAALPLIIFSLVSMAETTGQTALNAEIVGKDIDIEHAVPKTVRGDALVSLIGGVFGTSLLVTSGENIGIVRASGVRSRFVTFTAGIILILIGIFTPIARLITAIPAPVIGGTALVVYGIIIVMGVQMLRRVDFTDQGNIIIATAAFALGLLPILIPGLYDALPASAQVLLGSGVACGAVVAVLLNIVFHHLHLPHRNRPTPAATQQAPDMVTISRP